MPRPIVKIAQTVANITATTSEPTQKVVLVGPKYDLRSYDPEETAANEQALITDDYEPFVGDNLSDIGFNVAPKWDVPSITSEVDENGHSPKFYFEDSSFAVVYATESGVPSPDNVFGTAQAAHHKDLYHGATASDLWGALKMHSDSPYTAVKGDTVHIGHKIASKLVYSESPSEADVIKLRAPAENTFTLTIGVATAAVNVIDWDQANSTLYLHSTDVTAAAPGTVVTFAIDNGNTSLTGVLEVPSDQELVIDSIVGIKMSLTGPIHSFPVTSDAAAKKLDFRVDRKVTNEFPGVNSIEVSAVDDEDDTQATLDFGWDSTDNEVYLEGVNLPDLRDSSLPNIQTVLSTNCVHHVITRGRLYSTNRSFVSTESTLIRQLSATDAVSIAGIADVLNPLGLATSVAVANIGSGSIFVLPISSDNTAGYTAAQSILAADPDVYAMVPLSTDFNNVILPLANEADRLSDPSKSKFRIVVGASEPCPTREYLVGSPRNPATGDLFTLNADTYVLVDPQAAFFTAGVTTSDKIAYNNQEFEIQSILDDNRISIASAGNAELGAALNTSINYSVSRSISTNKPRQVEVLNSVISSVTSKRLVMVYPGTCTINGVPDLPGFYLSAAVGGMLSLFEPHRPKNGILLAGISGISTSNLGYFSPDQIDSLGDAGYFVLIQDTVDSAPYCVHQVTVAYKDYADTQEFSELSVVNNYDYVSKFLGGVLEPFVGSWNVTPQAVSSITSTLDAALIRLKDDWTDVIGSPILTYSIKDVSVSQTSQGTINVSVEVQLPRVLNTIVLEIVSA
jgi:hypothetical protein